MKLVRSARDEILAAKTLMQQLAGLRHDDAAELVRAVPPTDLLLLTHAVPHADALVLVEYASAAQVQRMLDLEAWSREEFTPQVMLDWLAVLAEVGRDKLAEFLAEVDPEYPALLIMKSARTVNARDFHEGLVPFDEQTESMTVSPDQQFVLIFRQGDPVSLAVQPMLDYLHATDADRTRMILEATIFEAHSAIEEDLFQFRNARLEEMGIPSMEEAQSIFRVVPLDREERVLGMITLPDPPDTDERLTDLALAPVAPGTAEGPLSQAVARLSDESRVRFYRAVVFLVNKVVVARGESVAELASVQEAGGAVGRMLNLALEVHGASHDSAEVLSRVHPEILFRMAYTRLIRLQKRARRLMERLGSPRAHELYDPPFDAFLEALLQREPGYVRTGVARIEARPFEHAAELDEAARVLEVLETWGRFYVDLIAGTPDASFFGELPEETRRSVTFSSLLATSLAHRLLGHGWSFRPLTRDDLAALASQPLERDRAAILTDFEVLANRAASRGPAGAETVRHLTELVERALNRLDEGLALARTGSEGHALIPASVLLVQA
jgi:hypothetical protein